MALDPLIPARGDFPDRYTVTADDWNDIFNTIYDYINNEMGPAIDDLIDSPPPDGSTRENMGLRLSLSSSSPAPDMTAPLTDVGTIYLHPYKHNKIGLWNGTTWIADSLGATPFALSVPAGNPFRIGNVYAFDNLGAPNIEIDWWDNTRVTATVASMTIGTSPVITTTGPHGLVAGDMVGILQAAGSGSVYTDTDRGLSGKKWIVTGVTTNTLQLESWDNTSLTSGAGGAVIYKIPTAPYNPQTRKDGVPVKFLQATSVQDPTRRFIGTIMTNANGLIDFAPASGKLGISNFYNTLPIRVTCYETLASWTFSDPGYSLPRSNSYVTGRVRLEFVNARAQGVVIVGRDTGRFAVQLDRVFRWNESNWYSNDISMMSNATGSGGSYTWLKPITAGAHILQLTNRYIAGYSWTLYSQTTDANAYGNMPGIDLLIGA